MANLVPAYDPWISLKKMLIQGGLIALIAFLTYLAQVGLPQLQLDLPEYAGIIAIVTGVIAFILNWYKHKDDVKEA